MVYIRINKQIKTIIVDKRLKVNNLVTLQSQEYILYKDLKKIAKKIKCQLHKYIHRKDIVTETQINKNLQLFKISQVDRKVIKQIRNKQKYETVSRSFINNLSIYSGILGHRQNIPIVQDVKKGLFMTFLFCATSLSGYLITSSIQGEPERFSAFGPILGGIVTFLYALRSNKRNHQNIEKMTFKQLKKQKEKSASITFNQNLSPKQSLKLKTKMKKS